MCIAIDNIRKAIVLTRRPTYLIKVNSTKYHIFDSL